MDIVPLVKVGPISTAASVGEVVLRGNQLAIVRPAAGPPPVVQLAAYDPQTNRFMNAQAQPGDEVLAFKGEYVLELDRQSATTGNFGPSATDELFFDRSTPVVVLHDPAGNSWRALNLSSGAAATAAAAVRPCFKRWKLGVRGADGEPTWLFQIRSRSRDSGVSAMRLFSTGPKRSSVDELHAAPAPRSAMRESLEPGRR